MSLAKRLSFFAGILLSPFSCSSWGQSSGELPENIYCQDPSFHRKVRGMLNLSIPPVDVEELKQIQNEVYIFDAREKEEYDVSHIPGAVYIGYKDIDWSVLENIRSDATIVVYCSIGYRSEKIAEKIQQKGFSNVKNLFGSIFEWGNRGYPLEGKNGESTKEMHTYNKNWSKWVLNDALVKIW